MSGIRHSDTGHPHLGLARVNIDARGRDKNAHDGLVAIPGRAARSSERVDMTRPTKQLARRQAQ